MILVSETPPYTLFDTKRMGTENYRLLFDTFLTRGVDIPSTLIAQQ